MRSTLINQTQSWGENIFCLDSNLCEILVTVTDYIIRMCETVEMGSLISTKITQGVISSGVEFHTAIKLIFKSVLLILTCPSASIQVKFAMKLPSFQKPLCFFLWDPEVFKWFFELKVKSYRAPNNMWNITSDLSTLTFHLLKFT